MPNAALPAAAHPDRPPTPERAGQPCPDWVACHDCGAVWRRPSLDASQQARCARCGALVGRGHRMSLQGVLALNIAALVVYAVAQWQPICTLALAGMVTDASFPQAVATTWAGGERLAALMALAAGSVFPLAVLLLRLAVLLPLVSGRAPASFLRAFPRLLRALAFSSRWSMVEVLMLAALVSVVRIADLARLTVQPGLIAFGALALLMAALDSAGVHRLWDAASDMARRARPAPPSPAHGKALGCRHCGLVSLWPAGMAGVAGSARCPRCDGPLVRDPQASLQRTWALLLAAAVAYLPANLLPVMHSQQALTGGGGHTILGGIVELWIAGAFDLAIIVFVASIAVPLLKMAVLAHLAWSAQRGSTGSPRQRSRLYRMVEAVGHWSMLDVFVVVLLAAMLQFGALARISPQPGLLAFGAVVVLTMLAAEAFDPQLIWRRPPARHPNDTA
ncbi:PqiA/YebS family transporter subunit [Aquabacterium sp. J223]|uniref:paraquat-inducible protein A n=1 Tax=Aquabacterium sp. J223 TaxID=2898431 RepID=UPI0021AE03CA|nr:PqiA/YebS family transporter subunit [Aquabacterium sp. J223]UUX96302.1 PqiA/YebS family transporter subunit [Aquabacterium sp. J223]